MDVSSVSAGFMFGPLTSEQDMLVYSVPDVILPDMFGPSNLHASET